MPCADPENFVRGGPTFVLFFIKNIGFISNTGPDPLKKHKATEPAFDDGPLLVLFESSLPSSNNKQTNIVGVGPPLAKISGSAHAKAQHCRQRRLMLSICTGSAWTSTSSYSINYALNGLISLGFTVRLIRVLCWTHKQF